MIVMALDHTRDFFNASAMLFSPEDLARTTVALFLTRWVTHICAPVFMFTAGIGAFLWLNHAGRTRARLSHFLWTRGLWLALLDLTIIRFAMTFGSGLVLLTPLWGLGCAMLALAVLIYLPINLLAVFSIAVIALHNLLDPITAAQFSRAAFLWNWLHQLGVFNVFGVPVLISYPLIPWFAVMSAGFCFGQIILFEPDRRRRWMFCLGLFLTVAFLVVRGINLYGDPVPWTTPLSFLRCNKYPPSLDFLLMTVGPAILLLSWLDRLTFPAAHPLIVFGRVPLFYFVLHLYVLHLLAFPLAWLRFGHVKFLLRALPSLGGSTADYPPHYGYPLWFVYALWAAVVSAIYPICFWYARWKQGRRDSWIGYI